MARRSTSVALQVGSVTAFELDKDGGGVTVRIFVNAPYKNGFLKTGSRFWHASRIDVSLSAEGISVDTESVASLMVGGLAFGTPPFAKGSGTAPPSSVFKLYANRADALREPDDEGVRFALVFSESVRGLKPGATVEFRGIPIGEVNDISTRYVASRGAHSDCRAHHDLPRPAATPFRPEGPDQRARRSGERTWTSSSRPALRAQLRMGNLLTGQQYVAFDFVDKAPPAKVAWNTSPPELPTSKGELRELQATLVSVARKLDAVPYAEIAADLHNAIASLDSTLKSTETLRTRPGAEVAPDVQSTLADTRATLTVARRTLPPTVRCRSSCRRRCARSRLPRGRCGSWRKRSSAGRRPCCAANPRSRKDPRDASDCEVAGAVRLAEPTRRGGVHARWHPCSRRSRSRCPSVVCGRGGRALDARGRQLDARDPVLCARGRWAPQPPAAVPRAWQPAVTVAVRTVAVPAAVDRPQFVVRAGDTRVNLDEFNRWAGPLRDEIARVVAGNLAAELGTPVITVSSALPAASDLTVLLDVQRFDAKIAEGVEVDIVWIVRRALDEAPGRSGRSIVREPIGGEGYESARRRIQPRIGENEPRHCRGGPRVLTISRSTVGRTASRRRASPSCKIATASAMRRCVRRSLPNAASATSW